MSYVYSGSGGEKKFILVFFWDFTNNMRCQKNAKLQPEQNTVLEVCEVAQIKAKLSNNSQSAFMLNKNI